MKYVQMHISPVFLLPDDADEMDTQALISAAIRDRVPGAQEVWIGRSDASLPAVQGHCVVGDHDFYPPYYYAQAGGPVPNICPEHARDTYESDALKEHQPMFERIRATSDLKPRLWQSGGGTMTIVIPTGEDNEDGTTMAPCYMGLQEGDDEEGHWFGGVSFYPTEDNVENGDGIDVLGSYGGELTPIQWADAVVAHYNTIKENRA